ncbi:hypothetical protein GEMRC1_003472 [Eukaryota sp. GEM-RC1]
MGLFSRSKSKLCFQCTFCVNSFEHIPLADDFVFMKLIPPRSIAKPITSNKCAIQNHKATFDLSMNWDVPLTMDSDSFLLKESLLRIQVFQSSTRGRSHKLGFVDIDLAVFAGESKVTTLIPLEECRFRGVLRCTVSMVQTSGDSTFRVPELPYERVSRSRTNSASKKDDLRVHVISQKDNAWFGRSPLTPSSLPVDSPPQDSAGSPLNTTDIVDELFRERHDLQSMS